MEKFEVIDIKQLDRAEHFHFFLQMETVIEVTVKLDVTEAVAMCKKDGICFQSFLLFKIGQAINEIENFRYDIFDGKLIRWERIIPTFCFFNNSSKLFYTLCVDMADNFHEFDICYQKEKKQYADCKTLFPQKNVPMNIFNVSCIPWLHFEHFSSNFKKMENRIVKMITIGKYKEENEKLMLPLTIQVSHAIADGYHVALLVDNLQKELNLVNL